MNNTLYSTATSLVDAWFYLGLVSGLQLTKGGEKSFSTKDEARKTTFSGAGLRKRRY